MPKHSTRKNSPSDEKLQNNRHMAQNNNLAPKLKSTKIIHLNRPKTELTSIGFSLSDGSVQLNLGVKLNGLFN